MHIDILTIFPELFAGPLSISILQRAQDAGALTVQCHDIRAFAVDTHRKVDDVPYGGGAGMVMKPEPLVAAIESVKPRSAAFRRTLLCPQGRVLTQEVVREYSRLDHLLLICGRYQGVDERVRRGWVDEELSIGDYVVSGGEFPALVVVDAVTRLLPGVLGNPQSLAEESHTRGLLEYPQYTRPEVFRGERVPKVLLSGNHREIAQWRATQARERTLDRRPDLVDKAAVLTQQQSPQKE